MSTFITPTLVRRYLKATGWTSEERPAPLDPRWFFGNHPPAFGISGGLPMLSEVARRLDGDTLPELCAHLGMLSVADALLARAAKLESSTKVDASWEAMKKRRADLRHAEILRDEAERIIEQADVNPKAWEAAR